MSRRYDDYDDRDYPSRPLRRASDDLDIDIRHSPGARRTRPPVAEYPDDRPSRRIPDFMRDDYDRNGEAQELAIRRRDDDYGPSPPRDRPYEREDIEIRDRDHRESYRLPPRRREDLDDTEISIRRTEREDRGPPRVRERSIEREDVSIRRVETDRGPLRPRGDIDRDDVEIRVRREESRGPPPRRRPEVVDPDELDIRIRREESRGPPPRRRPEGIDQDELDIRIRREESRGPPPRRRPEGIDQDELDIRIRREESRGPPPRRRPEGIDQDELDIKIRREESRGPPPRRRPEGIDREEVIIRRDERDARPSMRGVTYRRRSRSRSSSSGSSLTTDRGTVRSRGRRRSMPPVGRLVAREHEEFVYRRREPSIPPPPPPAPARETTEEIIIRRAESSPSPPPPLPEPEPEPIVTRTVEPEYLPPVHRDVITHVYTIDHGLRPASPPSPPPPPPPEPVKDESLEIDIRRKDADGARETIHISDREREGRPVGRRARSVSFSHSPRRRSLSSSPGRRHRSRSRVRGSDLDLEAEYYNRRAMERGYPGEAYNGATKDWEHVDVPPGTHRVQMDGTGGGSQEITWQRYNGARRAKFIGDGEEFATDYGIPPRREVLPAPPPAPSPIPALPSKARESREELSVEIRRREGGPPVDRELDHISIREREIEERHLPHPPPTPSRRTKDMWTEVTKDLVLKEAILESGYQFDETEDFFYIMEYLRYEDVLQLVQRSDRIRTERRRRIREIEWEREHLHRPHGIPPPPMGMHGPPPMPPLLAGPPIPPPPFLPPGVERIYDRERMVVEEGRVPRRRY
ncbi:hypothetical protein P152DRAFT_470721 [Eremomyces bilateralis CBS 781.70]|uniref:DUF8035 domain-containing protein n=1 Tax=Eremomyces bilateralis CBS 781.70 TaxID=1392243 RepID=A0A6G1GFN9_9PEZI|nr:uncharacterized protein P152DRAFT_470721 [Eremomyces bilateralis CBS 781.70]KAF1816736.1 hypothetical protein P152DRAFT_470721 [Eremomyces bilateralis CBS 781.70]